MVEELGDYLVARLIGEGGMGKVYEAEERLSKRRVALKVLRPELTRSEEGRRLFLNEMQILAHLEHPNIVRSLASIEVDGELVMVLEYLTAARCAQCSRAEARCPGTRRVEHRRPRSPRRSRPRTGRSRRSFTAISSPRT